MDRIWSGAKSLARRAWGFVKKHRSRFLIGGAVVGGSLLAWWYIRKYVRKIHNQILHQRLTIQGLAHVINSNDERMRSLVFGSFAALRYRMSRLLSTNELVSEMKRLSPADREPKWNELAVLSFSKVFSSIYALVLLRLSVGVQMAIQGNSLLSILFSEKDDDIVNAEKSIEALAQANEGSPTAQIISSSCLSNSSTVGEDVQVQALAHRLLGRLPGESVDWSFTSTIVSHFVCGEGLQELVDGVTVGARAILQRSSVRDGFTLKEFFDFVFSFREFIEGIEIVESTSGNPLPPKSKFIRTFSNILVSDSVAPPDSENSSVHNLFNEFRLLVDSPAFQLCFTETADEVFGALARAIKRRFLQAEPSQKEQDSNDTTLVLGTLVPFCANEAVRVLSDPSHADGNEYYDRLMKSSSPIQLEQFILGQSLRLLDRTLLEDAAEGHVPM